MNIERVGADLQHLLISSQPRDHFIIAHNLNRRSADADAEAVEGLASHLSDSYLVGSRRKVNFFHLFLFVSLLISVSLCLTILLS